MKAIIPNRIIDILNLIKSKGYEVYLVGGCVRDYFLGNTPHDFDITTNAKSDELLEIFKDFKLINNNGIKHNTISIYYENDVIEITSFKAKVDNPKIYDDLINRDITINAIAYDIDNGFINPLNGIEDIKNKMIRVCNDNSFKDDYLRVLRALRFSSVLSFEIDEATRKLIYEDMYGLINISKERINKELCNILLGDNVLHILLEYKEVFGIIIPQLIPLFNFNQRNKYHKYDIYTHTAYVVSNTLKDKNTRLAALLHDIGKPQAFTIDENGFGHFYKHPLISRDIALEILKGLRFSNDDIDEILYLVFYHDVLISKEKRVIKKMIAKAPYNNPDIFLKLADLRISDHKNHINIDKMDSYDDIKVSVEEIIKEDECFSLKKLNINGHDLQMLGYVGKEIGVKLKEILELVAGERLENEHDLLIQYAKRLNE